MQITTRLVYIIFGVGVGLMSLGCVHSSMPQASEQPQVKRYETQQASDGIKSSFDNLVVAGKMQFGFYFNASKTLKHPIYVCDFKNIFPKLDKNICVFYMEHTGLSSKHYEEDLRTGKLSWIPAKQFDRDKHRPVMNTFMRTPANYWRNLCRINIQDMGIYPGHINATNGKACIAYMSENNQKLESESYELLVSKK